MKNLLSKSPFIGFSFIVCFHPFSRIVLFCLKGFGKIKSIVKGVSLIQPCPTWQQIKVIQLVNIGGPQFKKGLIQSSLFSPIILLILPCITLKIRLNLIIFNPHNKPPFQSEGQYFPKHTSPKLCIFICLKIKQGVKGGCYSL